MKEILYFQGPDGKWVGARANKGMMKQLKNTCCFFGYCSMATDTGLTHVGVKEEDVPKIPVYDVD